LLMQPPERQRAAPRAVPVLLPDREAALHLVEGKRRASRLSNVPRRLGCQKTRA
jgi:hypothetical protein